MSACPVATTISPGVLGGGGAHRRRPAGNQLPPREELMVANEY